MKMMAGSAPVALYATTGRGVSSAVGTLAAPDLAHPADAQALDQPIGANPLRWFDAAAGIAAQMGPGVGLFMAGDQLFYQRLRRARTGNGAAAAQNGAVVAVGLEHRAHLLGQIGIGLGQGLQFAVPLLFGQLNQAIKVLGQQLPLLSLAAQRINLSSPRL